MSNTYNPATNQWSQNTSLSPAEQNLFNEGTGAEGQALGIAGSDLTNNVAPALSQHLQAPNLQTMLPGQGGVPGETGYGGYGAPPQVGGSPGSYGPSPTGAPAGGGGAGGYGGNPVQNTINSQFGAEMGLLQPQMQQASEQQNANLIAQGLNPNDAAWQNSQTLFGNQQGTEVAQAANNAVQGGNAEQNTLFGQDLNAGQFGNQALQQDFGNQATMQETPINEFSALMAGGQVQAPTTGQFSQTGVAPTDVTGAYALSQQQANANYQSQLAQYNSGLGGLFNLGSSAMMAFSDERLKEDIEPVGEWQGFPLYDYHYKGDDELSRGVLAQEVAGRRPDAVHTTPSGYLAVDYSRLAAPGRKLGGLYALGEAAA